MREKVRLEKKTVEYAQELNNFICAKCAHARICGGYTTHCTPREAASAAGEEVSGLKLFLFQVEAAPPSISSLTSFDFNQNFSLSPQL